MKTRLILLIAPFFTFAAFSQNFHVDPDSTTLIKNTSQSPAHWYIEIYNDYNLDTALRWKCHFENIPAAWNISFDDQDTYYPTIHDGDSADFSFPVTGSFPQKLIIGAALNDTPGTGSVRFAIFDPEAPSDTVTITYHFIVSAAPLGLDGPAQEYPRITSTGILLPETYLDAGLEIFDVTGRLIYRGTVLDTKMPFDFQPHTLYRVVLLQEEEGRMLSFFTAIAP